MARFQEPPEESTGMCIERGRKAADAGNWKQAANAWMAASQAGSTEAGTLALTAISQVKKLADTGDVEAQSLVAGMMLVLLDDTALPLVVRYASVAAGAGDAAALRTLGYLYQNGRGVALDEARAEELFMAASSAGDPYGAFNLAMVRLRVHGAARREESIRLLRQAAEGGVIEAAAALGDEYSALGDNESALEWYLAAALRGDARAMRVAGCRYRDGVGTAQDNVQAVRWFLTMLDRHNGDGVHDAIELARSTAMTDAEIHTAGQLAGRPVEAQALIDVLRRSS